MTRPPLPRPTHGIRRRHLVAAAGLATATGALRAQAFPARPITLIVPWPPGGSTDRHLRALAEAASKHLGQQVLVSNQPGGGGTTGPANMALQAKPDGYTVAQYPMGMMRIPHMQNTSWHPINDFSFIIGVTGYSFGLVVRSDSPYKTLNEYLDAARKQPRKIDFGNTGTGTSPHLLMEELGDAAGVELNPIPFKGNADLMQALLGGHVMAAVDAAGWDKFVDGGQMRLLATFGEQRLKRWPQVPTVKELGYNMVANSPYGLVGPKGMDPAVVKALHDGFRKAMDEPSHMAVIEQLNQPVWYRSGADYAAWARDTFVKERKYIEKLGLLAK